MFPHHDLPPPLPSVILFISFDHLSGGISQQPIHYLFGAVNRPGMGNVTDIMDATALLLIFIFITLWYKNFHSYIFEPIHQSPDGICFFNSWEFISSSAAAGDGDAGPLSPGLSQINGMRQLNLTGMLYEFQ